MPDYRCGICRGWTVGYNAVHALCAEKAGYNQPCPKCGEAMTRILNYGIVSCEPCDRLEHEERMQELSAEFSGLAIATGRTVYDRCSAGGTVPIDGSVTIYYPDGTARSASVCWNGACRLKDDWNHSITGEEAYNTLTALVTSSSGASIKKPEK